MERLDIGFIGVGKLGQACAEMMAEKHNVEGYDIQSVSPSNFNMVESIEYVVKRKDSLPYRSCRGSWSCTCGCLTMHSEFQRSYEGLSYQRMGFCSST